MTQPSLHALSEPQGMFVARVPIYGDLRFKDRAGQRSDRGISVGKEWTYRSFVEGGSPAAAIWTFHDITPERFPDGSADRNDDSRLSQPQGRHQQGNRRQPGRAGIRRPAAAAAKSRSRPRTPIVDQHDIPANLLDCQRQDARPVRATWSTNGDVEVADPVPGAGAVFRHGHARLVPAGGRRLRSHSISSRRFSASG